MVNHECKYEGKMAEVVTDLSWIKRNLATVMPKIEEMHTTFIQGEGKIKVLNKEVFGNGKPGLNGKLDSVEKKLNEINGAKKVWNTLFGTGFGITVLVVLLQAFNIIK